MTEAQVGRGEADPRFHRRPRLWEQILGVRIADPDGWREGSPEGARNWEDLISLDEFERRAVTCTVDTVGPRTKHNPWDPGCMRRNPVEPVSDLAVCFRCRDLDPHEYHGRLVVK